MFQALGLASVKTETVITGSYYGGGTYGSYKSTQSVQTGYGFKTQGTPSDDSIWYFYVQKPPQPPAQPEDSSTKVCRFYSLAPYLDRGLSVDDITTAIETGWKMLGLRVIHANRDEVVSIFSPETSAPTISFHKDTKLLIAVGEPSKLETIDAVLRALAPPKPSPPAPVPAPKPAETPKTEQ